MPTGIYKRSKEHLKKMSMRMIGTPGYWKGKKRPEMTGENHFYFGKHRSKEVKVKISNAKKGKPITQKHKDNISKAFTGNKHPNWKNGTNNWSGYKLIRRKGKYFREHRIIVEEIIGRPLTRKESVHHINEIKTNNNPSNLIAFTSESAHQRFHSNPNNVKPEEIVFDGRLLTK